MFTSVAAPFIDLGLVCLLRPEWISKIDREHTAFGTNVKPDETALADWWLDSIYLLGIGSIILGSPFPFDVI